MIAAHNIQLAKQIGRAQNNQFQRLRAAVYISCIWVNAAYILLLRIAPTIRNNIQAAFTTQLYIGTSLNNINFSCFSDLRKAAKLILLRLVPIYQNNLDNGRPLTGSTYLDYSNIQLVFTLIQYLPAANIELT